ncbi:MAG: hypothetical protein ACJAWV_004225 [Flammeovirgaceae bacterium]
MVIQEGSLSVSFSNNPNIVLHPTQKNEFGSNRRTKYVFTRNEKEAVNSFKVSSEGTVKNIVFKKLD